MSRLAFRRGSHHLKQRVVDLQAHVGSSSCSLGHLVSPCGILSKCPLQSNHLLRQNKGIKSISRRKLKDLQQGAITTEPLISQHEEDAAQYPTVLQGVRNNMVKFHNCVLLTRVGNFYELYFEHAEQYAPLLGLKLASKKTVLGPVAMAGFPFFQIERFLKILVEDLNKHVAISEEFSVAAPASTKSGAVQFERKVSRVVTPGTLIDEKFLNPYRSNFLLALQMDNGEHVSDFDINERNEVGLAWLDLSTGDFFTQVATRVQLPSILLRIGPREVLVCTATSEKIREEVRSVLGHGHELITAHQPALKFEKMLDWNSMLESPIKADTEKQFSLKEKLAGHLLLDYVQTRLQGLSCWLRHPQKLEMLNILSIDRSSLRGLEILETSRDGFGKGSLFHAVRRTVTRSGARLLHDRLIYPSASLSEINERLDFVQLFYTNDILCEDIIAHLRGIHDVKRLVQKFALNKGDADDMLSLANAITETKNIHHIISTKIREYEDESSCSTDMPPSRHPLHVLIARLSLEGPLKLSESISKSIDEEGLYRKHQIEEAETSNIAALAHDTVKAQDPEELVNLPKVVRSKGKIETQVPFMDATEPWIMQRGATNVLMRLHEDLDLSRGEMTELQDRLRRELSAPTLTLKWTPGLGHICHIKSANGFDKGLLEEKKARMVSSSKSTRSFYLAEWSQLGHRMDKVRQSIRTEEKRVFNGLRERVIHHLVQLRRNASIMDELDIATSFAVLAHEQGWTRPIVNNGLSHNITGGRHPTVKLGLDEKGRSFVCNDLILGGQEKVWVITGPNMAGKSTFLRQNALITILAQAGCYVPADHAEIGIVDQIFSRIGAADDLFRDQSTFMVEMLETAAILRYATPRSFVILDEVGRGTTPEDGTAVAFASLHHLYHLNQCRTLFATHFHALHEMTKNWSGIGRYCTDIVENRSGTFSFLHKLKPGVNKQSHALKVAKMAGLPSAALEIAKSVSNSLGAE